MVVEIKYESMDTNTTLLMEGKMKKRACHREQRNQ